MKIGSSLVLGVANPVRPEISRRLAFFVDSGVVHSVVPAAILLDLGIKPLRRESFHLADGTFVVRGKGAALFAFRHKVGFTNVVFGEKNDCAIVGTMTLQALGFAFDPLRRELTPLPMLLGLSVAAS